MRSQVGSLSSKWFSTWANVFGVVLRVLFLPMAWLWSALLHWAALSGNQPPIEHDPGVDVWRSVARASAHRRRAPLMGHGVAVRANRRSA